jgi:hypothetical protein
MMGGIRRIDDAVVDEAAERMTRLAMALQPRLLQVEPLEAIGALGVLMDAAVNRLPADQREDMVEAWISALREGLDDDDAEDGPFREGAG